jgi:hypothetical protein
MAAVPCGSWANFKSADQILANAALLSPLKCRNGILKIRG